MNPSTFDFNNINITNNFTYNINENLIVNIIRVNHGVASLHFTDKNNNKISIPNEIKVYHFDFQNKNIDIL